MNGTKNRKTRLILILIFGILLSIYTAGYVICRQNHFIVHVSACAGDKRSFHDVIEGDAKMASLNAGFAALYTPFRFFEQLYWYAVDPLDTPCPPPKE